MPRVVQTVRATLSESTTAGSQLCTSLDVGESVLLPRKIAESAHASRKPSCEHSADFFSERVHRERLGDDLHVRL
jgi:hypothetical protein